MNEQEYEQEAGMDTTPASMWERHKCNGQPTYRCAACWASAYDEDDAALTQNLRRLGYYDSRPMPMVSDEFVEPKE